MQLKSDLQASDSSHQSHPIDPTLAAQYDVTVKMAKGLIRLCLTDSILINVHEEPFGKRLWKKLSEIYQAKLLVNKIFLRKKLYSLRMEEGGQIFEHLERFNMLVTQLTSVGVPMDEEERCQILLCSLPDSWDSFVMVIGSSCCLEDGGYFWLCTF